ncbi:MAG: phosphoribosylamine--glycine ligase [Myxococcales bacterium]|nr:phosphoribosylamine--glycine ligase [Myxococcales bacterium]MCB9627441.1 phosphoribosylamine--glycine ligase [Sandaracinaceae bacterium]
MKVLVIGSGAREHALAWKLAQDEGVDVVVAPGNAGMGAVAERRPLPKATPEAIVALATEVGAGFVVVGPEAPLVDGAIDALAAAGIEAFGPARFQAQLEGSKIFSKEFMARHGVPTAGFRVFDDADEAEAYVRAAGRPLVVKADGLAAGKGVTVAKDADEAADAVDRIMRQREFGGAGARVLIEECLVGEEVSFHVVSDGERYVPMAPAQDHKRAYDGDQGPNTGGMGAYSPPPVFTDEVRQKTLARVVEPTLAGMRAEGHPFRGALFVGLMIVDGEPLVLEYNTRFGDPECESMMMRWQGSILPLLQGSARGDVSAVEPVWEAPTSLCVVLASGGYPGAYETGKVIEGLEAAAAVEGVEVFHAGTAERDGQVVTHGGRVLTVTAVGDTLEQAAERAYRAADAITFDGKMLRRDIGWRARSASPSRSS